MSNNVRVRVTSDSISTNCPLNEARWYEIKCNSFFRRIPRNGDPLGIVAQVALLARDKFSGVSCITVDSHRLTINENSAMRWQERAAMLRDAVRAAGFTPDCQFTLHDED